MICFMQNEEFNFISGIILVSDRNKIIDISVGVSNVEVPLVWEYPSFHVNKIDGGILVQFLRPINWFKFKLDIVVDGECTVSGNLIPVVEKTNDEIITHLKDKRVVFLGTARSCANSIYSVCEKIKELGSFFKEYAVSFYENDSHDNTLEELNNCTAGLMSAHIIFEINLDELMPYRTQRLAYARNKLLEHSLRTHQNFDYLCWLDMDGLVDHRFSTDGFLSNFKYGDIWDAVFPITDPIYYDIWALREKNIASDDIVWRTKHSVPNMIVRKNLHTAPSQLVIDSLRGWLRVDSAFGGFGIYKMSAAAKGRYVGIIDGEEVCEHVNYNQNITNSGGVLYINPQCITHYP